MHLRQSERPPPPALLRVAVDVEGRGEHLFELPSYATALGIHTAWREHDDDPGRAAATRLKASGYAVGLCWASAMWDLDTVIADDPSPAELRRVGDRVLSELQQAGYTFQEVVSLTNGLMLAIFQLFQQAQEVAALADFTDPPEAATPSSALTSGSPSPPTPVGSSDSAPVSV